MDHTIDRQGFDLFYGYLCQRIAHNYYPTHLWRNGEREALGNDYFYPHQRLPETADPDDPAGSVSEVPCAFWDWLPTFADLLGVGVPTETDGISLLPAFQGRADTGPAREYLYWEFAGAQAVRLGKWKGIRTRVDRPLELYDLEQDIGEKVDVAAGHPEQVSRITAILSEARTESELFPLVRPTRR